MKFLNSLNLMLQDNKIVDDGLEILLKGIFKEKNQLLYLNINF